MKFANFLYGAKKRLLGFISKVIIIRMRIPKYNAEILKRNYTKKDNETSKKGILVSL